MTSQLGAIILVLALSTGCGVLIGNVKPPTEKDDSYGFAPPVEPGDTWSPLDASTFTRDSGDRESPITDAVFQSKNSGGIIAVNSACRTRLESEKANLSETTQSLLLGLHDLEEKNERQIVVAGVPALETTIRGKLKEERVQFRAIVLQHHACIFDLMFIARPEHFKKQETVFSKFVESLRLN